MVRLTCNLNGGAGDIAYQLAAEVGSSGELSSLSIAVPPTTDATLICAGAQRAVQLLIIATVPAHVLALCGSAASRRARSASKSSR
jgi:hypothetical protein